MPTTGLVPKAQHGHPPLGENSNACCVRIKNSYDPEYEFRTNFEDREDPTVRDLKKTLSVQHKGCPDVEDQTLVYMGQLLKDDKRLRDLPTHGLSERTIHLMIKGGPDRATSIGLKPQPRLRKTESEPASRATPTLTRQASAPAVFSHPHPASAPIQGTPPPRTLPRHTSVPVTPGNHQHIHPQMRRYYSQPYPEPLTPVQATAANAAYQQQWQQYQQQYMQNYQQAWAAYNQMCQQAHAAAQGQRSHSVPSTPNETPVLARTQSLPGYGYSPYGQYGWNYNYDTHPTTPPVPNSLSQTPQFTRSESAPQPQRSTSLPAESSVPTTPAPQPQAPAAAPPVAAVPQDPVEPQAPPQPAFVRAAEIPPEQAPQRGLANLLNVQLVMRMFMFMYLFGGNLQGWYHTLVIGVLVFYYLYAVGLLGMLCPGNNNQRNNANGAAVDDAIPQNEEDGGGDDVDRPPPGMAKLILGFVEGLVSSLLPSWDVNANRIR